MLYHAVAKALKQKIGCQSVQTPSQSPSGVLNQCFTCETDKGRFFIKCQHGEEALDMYAAEATALELINSFEIIRVPVPSYYGYVKEECFLIMECIELLPHNSHSLSLLGEKMATLHKEATALQFGFEIDNTIGTTPQPNEWCEDWVQFFSEKRLGYLLQLIEQQYQDLEVHLLGEELLKTLPNFFEGLTITPSLLHGDLWSGNTGRDHREQPVIFDPASYFGHHEADLSIAKMFGGLGSPFFDAYHAIIPKEAGFEERSSLYQLYHYLNHYLLFGPSYRGSCLTIMQKLIK